MTGLRKYRDLPYIMSMTTAHDPVLSPAVPAPKRARRPLPKVMSLTDAAATRIRAIMAEHVDLLPNGRRSRDPDYEPHTFNLLPVAETLVTCAKRLRRLVISYRTVADDLLREADGASDPPSDDSAAADDDDIPF